MYRREKKKQTFWNKKNIVSLFIVLIMISSLLALYKGSQNYVGEYNDYKFMMENSMFSTKIDGEKVYFFSMPEQTLHINISEDIKEELKYASTINVLFSPYDLNIEVIEVIRRSLALDDLPVTGKSATFSISEYNETYEMLPMYSCENVTLTTLFLKTENETSIYKQDKCIVLAGQDQVDLLYMRDRLLYSMYGIAE